MPGARIELNGVEELYDTLRDLRGATAQAASEGHRQLAERQAAQIRAAAPLGPEAPHIRDTIRTRYLSPFLADVIVGQEGITPYLGHQEFGTRHQPARPFVRPAVAVTESAHEATMLAAARRRIR